VCVRSSPLIPGYRSILGLERDVWAVLVAAQAQVLDRPGYGENQQPSANSDGQHIKQRHVQLPPFDGALKQNHKRHS
jgi:hypothetical protein